MTSPSYDVFLSHNSRDKPVVRQLWTRLEDRLGTGRVFFDVAGIRPGEVIPAKLDTALKNSASSIVCFGPHGHGPWQEEEMWVLLTRSVEHSHRTAGKEDFRLIPVLLPGSEPDGLPLQFRTRLWVDFRSGVNDDEPTRQLIDRLVRAILGQPGEPGETILRLSDNPYRSLSPFTENDKDYAVFFGRERECGELATRLKAVRWVVVSEASGNGKSSLVRAGLRTDAAKIACPGIRDWTRVRFTPGHDLLHSFALAFIPAADQREAYVREARNALDAEPPACDAMRMLDKLAERFPNREKDRVLIILDQFEELFTQRHTSVVAEARSARRTAAVLDALAALFTAASKDPRFFYVLVVRDDYRMRLKASKKFWDLVDQTDVNGLQRHQYRLDELDENALREAIKRPAESLGAYFEPGLVAAICKDVYRQRGSMPLLQHALTEVWAAAAGRPLPESGGTVGGHSLVAGACLTYRLYEAVGGVTSALKRSADRILRDLADESDAHRLVCRNLLLRLVNLSDGGTYDTRRTLFAEELRFDAFHAAIAYRIIERLTAQDTRLLVRGSDSVEVTHEALLRECDIVREWIEDARKSIDLSLFRQLVESARTWAVSNRPRSDLWRGQRLEWASALLPTKLPQNPPRSDVGEA